MTALTDRLLADLSSALGLPIGLNDGELDETRALAELNSAYRFEIPTQISGWRREGSIAIAMPTNRGVIDGSTTLGGLDDEYGLPGTFKVLHEPVLVTLGTQTWPLRFTIYPEEFWTWHEKSDLSQGRPRDCLYYDESLTWRPFTDSANYTFTLHGIMFPPKLESITTDRLSTPFEETLVVAAAAVNISLAEGLEESAQRLGNYFSKKMNIAAAQSLANSGKVRRLRRRYW